MTPREEKPTMYVFEEAHQMELFDLVCPKCGTVNASPYKEGTTNLSEKCDECGFWMYPHCAIGVEHGKAPRLTIDDMHKELREYWELDEHPVQRMQKFEDAAERMEFYDFLI